MKWLNHKRLTLLGLILVLTFVVRFYHLSTNPPSLDWDELSLGWNSYSILKTGTDEYGNFFPLSIRSFNDYKPPLYVYTLIPLQAIFGLSDWSTRLPSAIFGTLNVLVIFFLASFLISKGKTLDTRGVLAGLVISLLFALTPWTIQFSRAAFETNLALFWFTTGFLGLVLFIKLERPLFLVAAAIAFSFSMYAYHSTRIIVPVFLLAMFILNFRLFLRRKLATLLTVTVFILAVSPLLISLFKSGGAQARFNDVNIFTNTSNTISENESVPLYYTRLVFSNWVSHFNPTFLFVEADGVDRHHAPNSGLIMPFFALTIIIAMLFLLRKREPWVLPLLALAVIAPLASSFSTGSPHAVRSHVLSIPLVFFSGFGLASSVYFFRLKAFFIFSWPLILTASCIYFLTQYFVAQPVEFARNWQYGYKELVERVLHYEDDYDSVVVTTYYDQPYIYFLYYGRISPVIKNTGYFFQNMDKYYFQSLKDKPLDPNLCCKILIASAPHELVPDGKLLERIYFPNGTNAFNIWSKQVTKR